jgi:hypothetical protein
MLMNPYHGEDLWDILPENYFQMAFSFCFKLAPELQREVDEFKVKFRYFTLTKTAKILWSLQRRNSNPSSNSF